MRRRPEAVAGLAGLLVIALALGLMGCSLFELPSESEAREDQALSELRRGLLFHVKGFETLRLREPNRVGDVGLAFLALPPRAGLPPGFYKVTIRVLEAKANLWNVESRRTVTVPLERGQALPSPRPIAYVTGCRLELIYPRPPAHPGRRRAGLVPTGPLTQGFYLVPRWLRTPPSGRKCIGAKKWNRPSWAQRTGSRP